jgi:serine/threonine protein kinase/formylglycine-generating enzyme required for sulfatase activity
MIDNDASASDPLGPIADEFVEAFRRGQSPSVEEFARRYPAHADGLRDMLPALLLMEKAKSVADAPGQPGQARASAAAAPLPGQIGRYRVERLLGQGGFGLVYLAHDDQLQRLVAIKVPHARLLAKGTDAEAHLAEARAVANLDHPNIVPVHDVGSTEDCPFFIVSKYIDGADLATTLRRCRLSLNEAVGLVATVADALHHAHRQGLVHRDVKPGNLLRDRSGKPYVADFGLALRERDVGKGSRHGGTPAYMSPEQARGEGHRVDGRSDIFSLGAVFYELLVGQLPFQADSRAELLELVTNHEPRPLRQIDEAIPKELERICFKALSKRASERYMTARDMADDLRYFLAEETGPGTRGLGTPSSTQVMPTPATGVGSVTPVTLPTPTSDHRPVQIVPKGLRSFDGRDADFFLELLPGPRDRRGLPDGIRFWKTRIEEADPDNTFAVGLIYGPSGCGKSSLVKAGLLPRLSEDVIAVYLEATAEGTEARLLHGLRKRCRALPASLGLKEAVADLRRGTVTPPGKKVLIVLDQFEQWLQAWLAGSVSDRSCPELVQALRQCDGARVQCVVLVRDDFWMSATRFMHQLEARLLEGHNSASVDLFDPDHARKVLSAFGRAFGRLPVDGNAMGREQNEFLGQAVADLAQEGKVISVRLALFAEMMKGKPWTPASLKAVGGTEGVGVTFLEETFSAATAPPEHRYHQKAARAVLKILLPETGGDIKGHMRSYAELLEASGYAGRPKDFDDLIRILDNEIRLLTPTDPEGRDEGKGMRDETGGPAADVSGSSLIPHPSSLRYYQLTHDYLIPSIREWLCRKQKETRRGRAELLLADRAAVWNARPENRQLPSLLQWFQIRWFTARKNWTSPQRKMMARAGRYHALRGVVVAILLTLIGWGGYEAHGTVKAHALTDRLLDANTADVPPIVKDMGAYHRWTDPLLRDALTGAEASHDARKQLHASLALLPVDATQVDYLHGRLLDAQPYELPVIRDALAPYQDALRDRLWAVARKPEDGKEPQRLRAAAALAMYDPEGDRWAEASAGVVEDLVRENPVFLGRWSEAFRPVRQRLLGPLSAIFRDHSPDRAAECALATNLLADYAGDSPLALLELIVEADDRQFATLLPVLRRHGDEALVLLRRELTPQDEPATEAAREALARRQAGAAAALARLGQMEPIWPLLKHSPYPEARSRLIHRLGAAGAGTLTARLEEEKDVSIRRALILALGECRADQVPVELRQRLVPRLLAWYRDDPDAGIHGAIDWLLLHDKEGEEKRPLDWGQAGALAKIDAELAARLRAERAAASASPGAPLASTHRPEGQARGGAGWYVNGQGQTLAVVDAHRPFLMGSPEDEAGRSPATEAQHWRLIGRRYAIATKPVTVGQWRRFRKAHPEVNHAYLKQYSPEEDCPISAVTWYEAAQYCRWLSEQEGIPEHEMVYPPVAVIEKSKDGGTPLRLPPDYLRRKGYRLPTEAEWEYACRAGARTRLYYGSSLDLLPRYCWHLQNAEDQTWPVGQKRPNDLGLFDMHGNVWNWCQEGAGRYGPGTFEVPARDEEDKREITDQLRRVLRGNSFSSRAPIVRTAVRLSINPGNRNKSLGLRVAQTRD